MPASAAPARYTIGDVQIGSGFGAMITMTSVRFAASGSGASPTSVQAKQIGEGDTDDLRDVARCFR